MAQKLTASQENYLETILNLSQQGPVRIRDIAKGVGVKLPSVTRAISRLAAAGLVQHESYGDVEITRAGTEAARMVVRRDECLTGLLREVLQLPEALVETEVCRLEHVLGHDVLLRLEVLVEKTLSNDSARWLKALHQKLKKAPFEKKRIRVGDIQPHIPGHHRYRI